MCTCIRATVIACWTEIRKFPNADTLFQYLPGTLQYLDMRSVCGACQQGPPVSHKTEVLPRELSLGPMRHNLRPALGMQPLV